MSIDNTQDKPTKADLLNIAFDESGLIFTDRASALEQYQQQGGQIVFDDGTGEPYSFLNGVRAKLSLSLAEFGLANKSLIDQRSLVRAKSKSDLKNTAEKMAFIRQHGVSAFERLPLNHIEPSAVVTRSDWRKLTLSQKAEMIRRDPDVVAKLRPDVEQGKTFVNHELLEKQQRIKGRSAK